jgi:multidrug efflux pump subunit AcrA (membrane-fusion protein)
MNKLSLDIRFYIVIAAILINLSGCSLIPKEEEIPEAPITSTYKIQDYKKVEVMRGDVIEGVSIDCTYEALITKQYQFSLDGILIDHVYVDEGDVVKVGDVLADLKMNNISEQIEVHKSAIELLDLKVSNEIELKEWAMSSNNNLKILEGYNSQIKEKFDSEIISHQNTENRLKDDLYIEKKRLELLYDEINQHQIISDVDGIVSYVAKYNKFDVSNNEHNFIKVYDPNTMVFIPSEKNLEYLIPGQKVLVSLHKGEVEAMVISAEDIQDYEAGETIENTIYLKVMDDSTQLSNGDQGTITLVLNERLDVLYLPSSAVHYENEKTIVYVEDEGGFKSIKEIEIGLTADRKVEILSGLMEGDSVIIN